MNAIEYIKSKKIKFSGNKVSKNIKEKEIAKIETGSDLKSFYEQAKIINENFVNVSLEITDASEVFIGTTNEIAYAMNEMDQGIAQEAEDAEKCLIHMENLSNDIVKVSKNANEIKEIVEETSISITDGSSIADKLTEQMQSTLLITHDIISEIEKLSEKSVEISKIINVINGIADQTNLLSLNASIEASRAGEAGRGFAVVSKEIRKLAETSKSSVSDINHIVEAIQQSIKKTVEIAQNAEKVIRIQNEAVDNTNNSFLKIDRDVKELVKNVESVLSDIEKIDGNRQSTLDSIENISAVLEETAASSHSITEISNQQLNAVVSLITSSGTLNQNVEEFKSSFKIVESVD